MNKCEHALVTLSPFLCSDSDLHYRFISIFYSLHIINISMSSSLQLAYVGRMVFALNPAPNSVITSCTRTFRSFFLFQCISLERARVFANNNPINNHICALYSNVSNLLFPLSILWIFFGGQERRLPEYTSSNN